MYKKALLSISLALFLIIFGFHFYLNFKIRIEPPSNDWSKEVLLSEGSIQCKPKLIKFKSNYIVAYGDGKNIKLLKVDSIGRKLEEKSIPIKDGTLKDIHLLTNDNELFMVLEMYKQSTRNVISFKGNENFEFKEEEIITNVGDVVKVDDYAIALSLEDKIEFIDFKQDKKSYLKISKQRFLMGSRINDGYILCYLMDPGEFDYVTIKNGIISEPKVGGYASESTKVNFQRATMIANDNIVNVLIEYFFQGSFGGARLLTFSLNSRAYEATDLRDFKLNEKYMIISNIEQFREGNGSSILATANRLYGGKKSFEDILKFDTKNGVFVKATPLSRSKEISLYANGSEDTAIFCDIIDNDTKKLYMVSSRQDFVKANNSITKNEVKLALSDTIESEIYCVGYIIVYGMFWILPSLFIAGILSLLEYKLNREWRRYAFIFNCIIATLIKWYFIYKISYVNYGMILTKLLSPWIGLGICIIISAAFYLPAYSKYKNDDGYKTIFVPFSISLFLESLFTLMFFGAFLV